MSHFLYADGVDGAWSDLEVPGGAAFTLIDQQLFKAINGDGGGAWAPAATIDIGGVGLRARLRWDLYEAGANAAHSYQVDTTRLIYLDNTISASRTYALSTTNALAGDVITIFALPTMSSSYAITVNDDLGAELIRVGNGAGCDSTWAEFIFLSSHWKLLRSGKPRNRIVSAQSAQLSTNRTTTSATYVAVTDLQLSLTGKAGDVISINWGAFVWTTDAAHAAFVKLGVTDGGSPTTLTNYITPAGTTSASAKFGGGTYAYTVVNTGAITLSIDFLSDTGAATAGVVGAAGLELAPGFISAIQIRP